MNDIHRVQEISLCMIVGNEETVIVRCLTAAAGAFDELCLVRAIGCGPKADSTLSLAAAWCDLNGKRLRCKEYVNRRRMPHVDDFAAARNLSFSLASCCWLLWLDADDVLDELNCRRIREVAKNGQFEGYQFLYKMPSGAEFFRERLMKRATGLGDGPPLWRGPVHEVCQVSGALCQVPTVEIWHRPPPNKEQGSASRNREILEGVVADLPRYWYYYAEELFLLKDPKATASGIAALRILPDEMVVERYEMMLNLISLDQERSEHWIFEAIKTAPLRREAFAYLVQRCLAKGETQRAAVALAWLNAVPEPLPRPWTHRAMWYGWGRDYLEVKVCRACGRGNQADVFEEVLLKGEEYRLGVARIEKGEI